MEVSGQLHVPAALPPREKPLVLGTGWAAELVSTRWRKWLRYQHHRLSSWPVPITKIKTVSYFFFVDEPGNFWYSVYTARAASGFVFQEFFSNILTIYFGTLLSLYCYLYFRNSSLTSSLCLTAVILYPGSAD